MKLRRAVRKQLHKRRVRRAQSKIQPKAKLTYASPEDPLLKTVLIRSIERLSGKRKLQKLYNNVLDKGEDVSFWEAALAQLQVEVEVDSVQLDKIPRSGPVLFIANHPYGVIDGLIICNIAAQTRQRFKILTNSALCKVDELLPYLLPIDFNDTKEAIQTNINTKKETLETLRQGGAVVIFPAGGIATAKKPFGPATDLEWKLFAGKLIQQAKATVVPVYFHGQNSRIFQLASQFSLTLRLSLIIHETNNKIGKTIQVSIGNPIPYESLATIKKRKELLQHLRDVIYGLPGQ